MNAFPTVYILDADGVIRAKNVRGEGLGKKVDELLVELKARGTD